MQEQIDQLALAREQLDNADQIGSEARFLVLIAFELCIPDIC